MAFNLELKSGVTGNSTCQVCNELDDGSTGILPCQHRFCRACLILYIKESKRKEKDVSHIPCLVCEKFIPNSLTQQSSCSNEITAIANYMNFTFCEPCTFGGNYQTPATHFCHDCKEQLCQICALSHRNMKALRNHTIVENNLEKIPSTEKIPFRGRAAIKTLEIDARLADDASNCYITGALFTSSGKVLLVDFWNRKLKLFGEDGKFNDSYECTSKPWDLTTFGGSKVAVTFPEENIIQIFKVKSEINKAKKSSKLTFIHCVIANGNGIMKLEKPVFVPYGLFKSDATQEDSATSFAIGFSKTSLLLGELSNFCRHPSGADVDKDGNIFVCDYKEGYIMQISKDKTNYCKIVENLDNPLTIRLNKQGDAFLVTCKSAKRRNIVEIYTVK